MARLSADDGRSGCNDAPPHRCPPDNTGIALQPSRNLSLLTAVPPVCYRARLSSRSELHGTSVLARPFLGNTIGGFCHELYWLRLIFFLLLMMRLQGQTYTPALPPPPPPSPIAQPSPNLNQPILLPRPEAPSKEFVTVKGLCKTGQTCTQEEKGDWLYLRGPSAIETTDSELRADELDYNKATGYLEARGHVEYENFVTQEKLYCDRAEYYTHEDEETGKFYNVSGSAPFRVDTRPGLLTTTNPFYFQAKWAEKIQGEYVLHEGFLTDCVLPNPWWTLRGKLFEIYPHDHAVSYRSWFYVRRVPIMYVPKFYKRLEKHPRRSGILLPSAGTNSLKGYFVDAGYYWAISRSYDLTYEGIYFTNVGLAHTAEFRGKVNDNTDFHVTINALSDKSTNPAISAGGYDLIADGRSALGNGWEARGHLDLLSSFAYRSEFSYSIADAVQTQTTSVGFIDKHWSDYGVTFAADRNVDFLGTTVNDQVQIRELPEADFTVREHEILDLPIWFTFDTNSGFMQRTEPDYQTRRFVNRSNFEPAINTSLHFLGIYISPSLAIHETFYGSSFNSLGQVTGADLIRSARDVGVNVILPSLERVFNAPSWIGEKMKHVIEPRITYRWVSGIDNFNQIVRFDQTDLLSDTNQVEFSLTNRLLAKDKNGAVTDLLNWQLFYDRYFNPTFGGAVVPGQPNLVESIADLTGYTFLYGPRNSSPIVSRLGLQTKVGLDWRTEWDPIRRGFIDTGVNANYRFSNYTLSVGETRVRTDPILLSNTDQLRAQMTYGNQNRRGLNYGGSIFYDVRQNIMEFATVQASYNTDCCGLTLEYRRWAFGTRDEHQFLFSFGISNIGAVGTLNKAQRMF